MSGRSAIVPFHGEISHVRSRSVLPSLMAAFIMGCGADGPAEPIVERPGPSSRIAFRENRYDERGTMRNSYVAVVNADGSGHRLVTPAHHFVRAWDWNETTNRVVYVAHGVRGMFVIDAAAGTPLAEAQALHEYLEITTPRWSPDGRRIAFVAGSGGAGPAGDVHVVNADGTALRSLAEGLQAEGPPSWSPDGSRIAFASGGSIWTVRADGSGQTASVAVGEIAPWVRWSPTGQHIAYTVSGSVWTIGSDLRDPRRISAACSPRCPGYLAIAWSPSGTRILAHRSSDPPTNAIDDFVAVALDVATGTELVRLADARGTGDMSADGTRIAFTRWYGSSPRGLLSVSADGSDERVVWRPESGFASEARWLP